MITKNQIKYIKDLSRKAIRSVEKKFVVEGEKLIVEMLQSKVEFDEIFAIESWIEEHPTIPATLVSTKDLERISQLKSPNKVLAVVHMFEDEVNDDVENGVTLFLDRINDPGNLGTIIRMADWFGVRKVICTEQSVDVYNSKVIQSSMGSVFRIPVFYQDAEEYLSNYKIQFPENPIIGAAMQGEELGKIAMPTNGLLVMGSESHGIDETIESHITQLVTIPKMGYAESLNVAVATGIVLWEWKRG
ncbi:MAG: TrmH family RNA methyltransferase [Salibacteraceae bacterium]|jgi:TrmH family RNA methyltransferase